MKLKQIEAFNAVMLSGSVSAAAKILNVSQPAVTQTLQHAELQLGYPLFLREKTGLKPTQEARELYKHSRQILEQVDDFRRLAQSLGQRSTRPLRISVVPSLSTRCLSQALGELRKAHPERTAALRVLHSDEIVRSVALQECDLGIVYGEFDLPHVQSEVLAQGHLVWAQLKTRARDASTQDIQLSDIAHQDFIGIDKDDPVGQVLHGHLSHPGGQVPSASGGRGRLTAQTYQSAIQLTQEGLGPCIIDSFTAHFSAGDTVLIRGIVPRIPVKVSAIFLPQERHCLGYAEFLDAFRTVLATGQE